MKNCLIITLFSLSVSISSYAATCPPAEGLNPQAPPAGWSLLMAPIVQGGQYHFGSAIHSLNGSFYYEQVICTYESCPSWGCPSFELLSNDAYQYPESNTPPWNHRPMIAYTLVCNPANHDPSECIFK